jgi:hypothetical protein
MSEKKVTWGLFFLIFLGACVLSAFAFLLSAYAVFWLWPYAFGAFDIPCLTFQQACAIVGIVWVLSFPFKYNYTENT